MIFLRGIRIYLEVYRYDKKENSMHFKVFLNNGTEIGNIVLRYIDSKRRCATIGMIIENQNYRGNGYGTEAGRVLLDYSFNILGLRRVEAETMENNEGGQRSLEKIGLVLEGKKRKAKVSEGRWWDIFYYGILREEFNKHK